MKATILIVSGLLLTGFAAGRCGDSLTASLQEGLIQEEANRNLTNAIAAYEQVVQQLDQQRQIAATAVFRLGECYRKLGRTDEAVAAYRRIIREFPEETTLARLSEQNLTALGASPAPAPAPHLTPAGQRQRELLQQELALIEEQLASQQQKLRDGLASRDSLIPIQRDVLAIKRQIAEVEGKVRPDLLDLRLPADPPPNGASPTTTTPSTDISPAEVASLRQEIKLLEDQLAWQEARSGDRVSPGEVVKTRQELLRLQRRLPENASPARQQALIGDEIKLAEKHLANTQLLLEAGRVAPTDAIQARRDLLALQRDLAAAQRAPATTDSAPTGPSDAAEAAQLAGRLDAIDKLKPDLEQQARAVLVFFPDEGLDRMLKHLPKLVEQEAAVRANPEVERAMVHSAIEADGTGDAVVEITGLSGQPAPYLEEQVAAQRQRIAARTESILQNQRARLFVLQNASSPTAVAASPVIPVPDPAEVESLREEINLVDKELQSVQKQFENGKASAAEVRKVQRDRLSLQRRLPENASTEKQVALLQEALQLVQTNLIEIKRMIEVGAAPPLDEISARRELLAVQRELAVAQRAPSIPAAAPAGIAPATAEEAAEIDRIKAIIQDSPDLVNAHNATNNGGTPLHNAANQGYLAVTAYLLANHADVNARDNPGATALHLAAQNGHKRLCEVLLAAGADVNAATDDGYTALHYAAMRGYLTVAETLFAKGAEVNTKGYVPPAGRQPQPGTPNWLLMDTTPLHSAAERGFPAMVELLLKNGAELNATDRGGRTPLMRAVLGNQPSTVGVLLRHGADVNALDTSRLNALAHAVRSLNPAIVTLLLEAKAGLELQTAGRDADKSWTVLFDAIAASAVDLTRLLLDRGANINARADTGLTPLHLAVAGSLTQNPLPLLRLLLERKPDLNARDNAGNTSLHYALENSNAENTELLLAAGADPNIAGWTEGTAQPWWPLFRAVLARGGPEDMQRLTELLLKHGADVKAKTSEGWTALHLAAQYDLNPIARLLLANGADANAQGNAPADVPNMATRSARPPSDPSTAPTLPPGPMAVQLQVPPAFLSRGGMRSGDLSPDAGVTPLHLAVARLNLDLAQALLKQGADLNARDSQQRTPLHFAVNRRDLEMMRLLLDAKADPDARDVNGITPFVLATQAGRGITGLTRPTGAQGQPVRFHTARDQEMTALLSQRGASVVVSDPNAIIVFRRSSGYQNRALTRGQDDPNQFTLFELLALEYGMLRRAGQQSDPTERTAQLGFPDWSKVRILRTASDGTQQTIEVNLTETIAQQNCAGDMPLQWGDIVEVPEEDHPLNASWEIPDALRLTLKQCLGRKVEIRVKGEAVAYQLALPFERAPDGKSWILRPTKYGWDLPTTLERAGLLRTSSDRTGVLVTRRDPLTGTTRQWRVDCTQPNPTPLWLRDGDVIEVPERAPEGGASTRAMVRILGEVKQPGTLTLPGDGRLDVIDAIAQSGGFTSAAGQKIILTRRGNSRTLDFDALKAESDPARKTWLEPGDLLEVKPKLF